MINHTDSIPRRPIVWYDITNLIKCTQNPTPTGIDRIDLVYARFLIRSSEIDLRPVYVQGNYVHLVSPNKLRCVVHRLRRIWDGKEAAYIEQGLFSPSKKGIFLRYLNGMFSQLFSRNSKSRRSHPDKNYYINISQRNLASPGLVKWIERQALCVLCVIHDLLPITHPEYFDEHASARHHEKLHTLMNLDARMICGSRSFTSELSMFSSQCGFPQAKTIHAAFGCNHLKHSSSSNSTHTPSDENFFLILGTFEPRKNHLFLLRVWLHILQKLGQNNTPRLIMAGRNGKESSAILSLLNSEPMLASKVSILEGVSDLQIANLIESATAVLMPSISEGYGLPLYESFALRTPVIASDLPVLNELSSSIAQLVPISDMNAWTQAIEYFEASGECQRQKKLLNNWRRPTWSSHFRHVLAALRN